MTLAKTKAKPKYKTRLDWLRENWLRVVVHVGAWLPLLWLVWRYMHHELGVDPVTTLNNVTGRTAMILLLLCLSATPLYIVFNFRQGIKVRRALGLYAFMYAGLHFINFVALDYALDLNYILGDGIPKKPYILVGFAALVLLFALAITSTRGWMRRLKKNWSRLHWLVYPIGVLVIFHFLWQAKAAEQFEPLVYGAILTLLLVVRVPPVRHRIIETRQRLTGRTPPRSAQVPAVTRAQKEIG